MKIANFGRGTSHLLPPGGHYHRSCNRLAVNVTFPKSSPVAEQHWKQWWVTVSQIVGASYTVMDGLKSSTSHKRIAWQWQKLNVNRQSFANRFCNACIRPEGLSDGDAVSRWVIIWLSLARIGEGIDYHDPQTDRFQFDSRRNCVPAVTRQRLLGIWSNIQTVTA